MGGGAHQTPEVLEGPQDVAGQHLECCHPEAWVQTPILLLITSVMLDTEAASVDSETGEGRTRGPFTPPMGSREGAKNAMPEVKIRGQTDILQAKRNLKVETRVLQRPSSRKGDSVGTDMRDGSGGGAGEGMHWDDGETGEKKLGSITGTWTQYKGWWEVAYGSCRQATKTVLRSLKSLSKGEVAGWGWCWC